MLDADPLVVLGPPAAVKLRLGLVREHVCDQQEEVL